MPLNSIVLTLVALAACIASCIVPTLLDVGNLMSSRRLRRAWQMVTSAIGLCIALFLTYGWMKRGATSDVADVVEASVMVIGSLTMLGVVHLTRWTARDILRIVVLETAAFTDPLTGLGNRRLLDERLAEAMESATATGLPLSLVVIDIDHFKRVNDAHGHGAGDLVLKQVAKLISAKTRHLDTACRVGGEEFVVIVPGLDEASAAAWAERLRRAVAETVIPLDGGGEIGATVSLGLATLGPGDTADLLLRRADAALYGAKRGGRDRVSLAA